MYEQYMNIYYNSCINTYCKELKCDIKIKTIWICRKQHITSNAKLITKGLYTCIIILWFSNNNYIFPYAVCTELLMITSL